MQANVQALEQEKKMLEEMLRNALQVLLPIVFLKNNFSCKKKSLGLVNCIIIRNLHIKVTIIM